MRQIPDVSLTMEKGNNPGTYQVKDRYCTEGEWCFTFNCRRKDGYRQCERLVVVDATAVIQVDSGELVKVKPGAKLCRTR